MNLFNLPFPSLSPEGVESGGAGDASPSAASTTPDAPAAPTPTTPSTPDTAAAPQSHDSTGGLRDAASDSDFTIPDLSGLDDMEEIVIPAQSEPTVTTPDVKAAEVQQTPPPPTQTAEPPKVETPQEQQGQQPKPSDAAEPATLAQMLQQNRGQLIDEMAKTHFALSPAEVEALQDDAVTAIPKLLAKVHMDAVSTALTHMATFVPKMIEAQGRISAANTQAKDQFFTSWPQLKGREAEVARMAVMYRQMNPQAKLDDVIRDVGPIVMAQLKMSPAPATNGTAPQKARPTAFAPAVGGVPAAPPAAVEGNPWSGLGQDFD